MSVLVRARRPPVARALIVVANSTNVKSEYMIVEIAGCDGRKEGELVQLPETRLSPGVCLICHVRTASTAHR